LVLYNEPVKDPSIYLFPLALGKRLESDSAFSKGLAESGAGSAPISILL